MGCRYRFRPGGPKSCPGGPRTSWVKAMSRPGCDPRGLGLGRSRPSSPYIRPPTSTLSSETSEAGGGVATLYHAPFEDK